jgi:hypothetical protein
MVSTLPANPVTLADLEMRYGLNLTTQEDFFTEWLVNLPSLTKLEQQSLDRVSANFTSLLKTPPLLENSVKMVMLRQFKSEVHQRLIYLNRILQMVF